MVRRRRRHRRAHLVLAIVSLGTAAAHADKEAGLDGTVTLPLSPWSNATGPGFGGSLWLRVPAAPLVDVTLRVGAAVHGERPIPMAPLAHARLSEIPLLGGARYRITDGVVRAYLEGEVGLVFARTDVDVGATSDHTAPIRLASSLGVALELDRFILRADVWLADLSDLDRAIGVTVSLGARVITW